MPAGADTALDADLSEVTSPESLYTLGRFSKMATLAKNNSCINLSCFVDVNVYRGIYRHPMCTHL